MQKTEIGKDLERYGITTALETEGQEKYLGQKGLRLVLQATANELKKKAEKTHKHAATDVIEDATHKFVSDVEKGKWEGKAEKSDITKAISEIPDASKSVKGLMTTTQVTGMETMGQDIAKAKQDITGLKDGNLLPKATATKAGIVKIGANITVGEDGTISTHAPYQLPATLPGPMITEDATHRWTTDAEKKTWADKYTKAEIDNFFSQKETNTVWKAAVETFGDIAKTYPTPQDGWTVNVNDTDITYRYTGTEWIAISANAIPKATQSLDGLMTKEDKKALDGVDAKLATKAEKTHSHNPGDVTEDATHRFATDAEKTKWNKAADDATYARTKADSNKGEIDTLNGKVTALETKVVLMTEAETKAIINEFITGAFPEK